MPQQSAIVVGAGIVGLSVALYLQRDGVAVTVIDPRDPGTACSFGNSGGFGIGLTAPIAMPGLLPSLPRMLLHPDEPLSVRPSRILPVLPWFLRFLRSSRPAEVARIAAIRAELNAMVFPALQPLLRVAAAESLVERKGMLFVYGKAALSEAAQARFALSTRHGIEIERLSGDAARALNPALGDAVRSAMLIPGNGHCTDPGKLARLYAEAFAAAGGRIVRGVAERIEAGTKPAVFCGFERFEADRIVIAAGAWSKQIAAQLGFRVLLEAERGYHLMLGEGSAVPTLPTTIADRNIVVTPMDEGVRITGIAEFDSIEAPPRFALADRLLGQARAFMPGLRSASIQRWMGPRPSTPDSLPVIGPAPGHPNILLAFGHGQSGLAWASSTGRLIADLATGRTPFMDLAPLSASRFARAL